MMATKVEERVEHFRGCPAPPNRIEAYVLERGVTAGLANALDQRVHGEKVSVIRCGQCGGQVVIDDGGAANAAFRAERAKGSSKG